MKVSLNVLAGILAWAVLFGWAPSARAAESVFKDKNFAITTPEGWNQIPVAAQPDVVAALQSPDGIRTVVVIATGNPVPLDERFVAGFEQGVQKHGGEPPQSSRYFTWREMPSYERIGNMRGGDGMISAISWTIPTDKWTYLVQGMKIDGNVADDPVIKQVMESFRFVNQPTPPRAKSPAYQAGRAVGTLVGIGIIIAIVLAAIVGVGVGIFFAVRAMTRKSKR